MGFLGDWGDGWLDWETGLGDWDWTEGWRDWETGMGNWTGNLAGFAELLVYESVAAFPIRLAEEVFLDFAGGCAGKLVAEIH